MCCNPGRHPLVTFVGGVFGGVGWRDDIIGPFHIVLIYLTLVLRPWKYFLLLLLLLSTRIQASWHRREHPL